MMKQIKVNFILPEGISIQELIGIVGAGVVNIELEDGPLYVRDVKNAEDVTILLDKLRDK